MSDVKFSRFFATASHATFTIKPVRLFVERYVGDGKGWADPFAGFNSPAQYTNDLNPEAPTQKHVEAKDFVKFVPKRLNGVLFDPPFSYRQISEHYRHLKKKATALDTSYNFYRRVMIAFAPRVKVGGIVLSFGWNTNGFGKGLGFETVEVVVVQHGLHHNDTLCTAERKVR